MNISRLTLQLCIGASASAITRGSGEGSTQSNARIIGGDVAIEGRYSYAVSLQNEMGHFCGGSLIARDIVLSAAHCVRGVVEAGGWFAAVVGSHDLGIDDGEGEVRDVAGAIVHEGYAFATTDNDFAIIVLDPDQSSARADVDLVRIAPDVVNVGTMVTVMGWGDTNPSDFITTPSHELLETQLYILSNESCERSSGIVGGFDLFGYVIGGYEFSYRGHITENMVCATDSGEDSCQGDSGGPLVIRLSSGDVQIGVVSWGAGCAYKNFPGVYARVSAGYEWIREQVCEYSEDPPSYFDCDVLI